MQIIPVIDIRNGIAVRAVAGERKSYQPLASRLTRSAEPAEVLKSLQTEFASAACYVADLDGIERRQTNRCTLAEMARTGVELIVDAGVTAITEALQLLELGVAKVILSSESLREIDQLPVFLAACDPAKIIFSVDLKLGELLSADPTCKGWPPADLISKVVGRGIQQLLVLDLAAVGTGSGIPTLDLCRNVRQLWPDLNLISGGGVHSLGCVQEARQAGLDGLLISSALHDGRLQPQHFRPG